MSEPFGDKTDPRFTPDGKADPNFRAITLTADHRITVTTFDLYGRDKQEATLTLGHFVEFAAEVRKAKIKEELPLGSPWQYGNVVKLGSASYRTLANLIRCACLFVDYDGEDIGWLPMVVAKLRALGVKAVIVPTPSYTPEAPRFRLLVPLAEMLYTADAYRRLVARLDALLNCTLAFESYNPAQGYFYGVLQGHVPFGATWIDGHTFFDLVSDYLADREDALIKEKGNRKSVVSGTPEEIEADKHVAVAPEVQLEYLIRRAKKKLAAAPPDKKYFTLRDVAFWIGGIARKLTGYTLEAIAELLVDWLREASSEMADEDHARDVALKCLRDGAAKPLLVIPELESVNLGPPSWAEGINTESFNLPESDEDFFALFARNEAYYEVPAGTLKPEYEATIRQLAARDGVSPDALILAYLIAVSGLVDKKTRFRPYIAFNLADNLSAQELFELIAAGPWDVPPILWFLIVAKSGDRKTRLWQLAFRVAAKIKARLAKAYSAAMKAHNAKPAKERGEAPDKPNPVMINDATLQAAEDALALADGRLVMKLDEAATWLGSFGRWNSGAILAERGGWNTFYEGGPLDTLRVGRKAIGDCNGLPVFGLIQPHAISELKESDPKDGILQRTQAVATGEVPRADPHVKVTGLKALEDMLEGLFTLPAYTYRCELAGSEIIQALEFDEKKYASMPDVSVGFQLACGKLHGLLARVALVLHLMEAPKSEVIATECIERADRLVRECLLPSTLVFFDNVNQQAPELAQRVGAFILMQPRDIITPTMLVKGVRALDGYDVAKLNVLMDYIATKTGCIDRHSPFPSNKRWFLKPGVREKSRDKLKLLQDERAAGAALLAKLKQGKSPK